MIPASWAAVGLALTTIASGLAGWTARDWKADSDQLKSFTAAEAKTEKARKEGLAEGKEFALASQDNQQKLAKDERTLREIYREVQVPGDCVVPDAALRLLQDAVRGANAPTSGEPGSGMPAD